MRAHSLVITIEFHPEGDRAPGRKKTRPHPYSDPSVGAKRPRGEKGVDHFGLERPNLQSFAGGHT